MNAADLLRLKAPRALPAQKAAERSRASCTPTRAKYRFRLRKPLRFGMMLGPVLFIILWSVGSWNGLIDSRILPAPWVAAYSAADLIAQGKLQANLAVSAERAGEGMFFGILFGVAGALFAGLTRTGEYLIDGLVQIKRAIPIFALIPFFFVWFGIGEFMKVTVIALAVFFPIYINTYHGLRAIDVRFIELAESLRIGYVDFLRHIVFPGALPSFLLGLRFAVTAAWMALVVVEEVNATSGIGYMMDIARTYAQSDVILVGLLLYGGLGLVSDTAVRLLERYSLSWRRTLAG